MADGHANTRLEAFSDGVFAIAMTLLIIDIKPPRADAVGDIGDFWHALHHLAPAVSAFLLSFCIVLITWVNHRASLKLVSGTSTAFMYANGFLLLTVVFIPFPTALLGEFVLTDHAAPAVFLYNGVLAVQAISWILVTGTALSGGLAADDNAATTLRANRKNGYFAFVFYGALAAVALRFPLPVAIVTTISWIFWLILSIERRFTE
jgi:uncharacterized membrane protein